MENEIQNINQGTCPLCKREAEWIPIDFGSKKRFKCKRCNQFLIPRLSEATISEASKSDRGNLSVKSNNCQEDMLLHIYIKDNKIISEPVLKSNWC